MFQFFKRKAVDFFSPQDKEQIVDAIKKAEHKTSGEIRVYIESDCNHTNAIDRAIEIFEDLEIYNTKQRNGVLVYVAIKARKLAIYGDQGIYESVGKEFWDAQVEKMIHVFNKNDYAEGIATIVKEIGDALRKHFPYDAQTDVNELPDDIVFGN